MPDPEKGCDDVNDILRGHMFKYHERESKKFAAAILGAHTLGRARI